MLAKVRLEFNVARRNQLFRKHLNQSSFHHTIDYLTDIAYLLFLRYLMMTRTRTRNLSVVLSWLWIPMKMLG